MKAVIQRINKAEIIEKNEVLESINKGLLVFLGIAPKDTQQQCQIMINKIINLRIFNNEKGQFDRSLREIQGEILIVSQFTLFANTKKGMRPSFFDAAPPEYAKLLYNQFVQMMKAEIQKTKHGVFASNIQVSLENDGPVTIILES